MEKIEHIGIAVKDLESATSLYSLLLGVKPYKMEQVASEQVNTSFFKVGETKVELLEGTSPESAITRFIEKKGEGIHHIAFEVADIRAEMERLREEGFQLLNDEPKRGADNKLVCFIHPKSARNVLVELCQTISLREGTRE
jgi:methylmalonyl-CoA/ethylmalonyl-CoA epimerase